jgi:hypothetical protein
MKNIYIEKNPEPQPYNIYNQTYSCIQIFLLCREGTRHVYMYKYVYSMLNNILIMFSKNAVLDKK